MLGLIQTLSVHPYHKLDSELNPRLIMLDQLFVLRLLSQLPQGYVLLCQGFIKKPQKGFSDLELEDQFVHLLEHAVVNCECAVTYLLVDLVDSLQSHRLILDLFQH